MDVVLDTIAGAYGARSLRTLRPGGRLVSILPLDDTFPVEQARDARIRAGFVLVEPDRSGLQAVADLMNSGKLQVNVDAVVPLEVAAKAHPSARPAAPPARSSCRSHPDPATRRRPTLLPSTEPGRRALAGAGQRTSAPQMTA
ncbi:zinc-binding dehydrogenase [Streptomyces sioyaensis]|uniref:zinc-binding dehydrogenase n=1 Tax=Streptomyces sioyaensis TaxID=67364 RepID=UPI00379A595D